MGTEMVLLSSSTEILFSENIHINYNKKRFYLIGSDFGILYQFHPHNIEVIYLVILFMEMINATDPNSLTREKKFLSFFELYSL